MQILVAMCSNILKTMTVVIFGGPWWFDHIIVEARVYDACAQNCVERRESVYKSAFLQGAPSQRRFDM